MKSGFVAIVGRPNAGKSTLLNQVLGARVSIVTPKAQTTRDRVLGILTEKEGQIVFIDTPGIHRAEKGGINEYMVAEAKEALEAPSVVWYLLDPHSGLEHEVPVLDTLEQALKGTETPVFVLLNKTDLLKTRKPLAEAAEKLRSEVEHAAKERGLNVKAVMNISAEKKLGTRELLLQSWALLPEGPRYYEDPDQLSDRPTRYFVAEMIREQLLMCLGEEVPYSCAVEIERFLEDAKPVRIEAVIHVERESQKGIVVGKGGQKIKEIGSGARQKVEEFLGQKVFLGLRVKLLKDWTKDAEALKRMGYNIPKSRPSPNPSRK